MKPNGTQVSIFGEMFIRERARFFKGAEEQFETLTGSKSRHNNGLCKWTHPPSNRCAQVISQQTLQT